MNLITSCLLIVFLNVSATGFTQKVDLAVKSAPIAKVFKELKKQTGYTFAYSRSVVQQAAPVTASITGANLDQALSLILKDQPLSYTIIEHTVVIGLKKEKPAPFVVTAPAASVDSFPATGKVANMRGEMLMGATITEKNVPRNAVKADADGNFAIKMTKPDAILIITFAGYSPMEIKGGSKPLIIVLNPSSQQDVVVVGYGTQRNKDLTGSVAAVNNKDFNQGMNLSPQQAIQGKIPGVNISQNSGKPGGSNTVRIRGGTSITASNEPLYVIDGFPISVTPGVGTANISQNGTDVFDEEPTNPLMTLNPDDIESVTVLKDASAAAIYGSRGANGVIIITTKKGAAGRAHIAASASAGISRVAKKLDMLSAADYRKAIADQGLTIDDKGANTNWQDKIFQTGVNQDYYVAMTGGSEKTTYKASFGYGTLQGVVLGSRLNRGNLNLNLNHSVLNDRLNFDMRVNYGGTFSNTAPISNTVGSELGTSMNYEAYIFNPTYPVYDPSGNYYFIPPYRVNPVSFSTDVLDQTTNHRFLGDLSTTLKIVKPLSITVNLGYTKQNIDRNSYIKQTNLLGRGFGGYASVQKLADYSKLLETVLKYTATFGKHSVNAIGGYSWQYFANEGDRTTATGFISDDFLWYSLQAAKNTSLINTFKESNTLVSFYSRVNYNFDDRFLVTATLRRDGSSRFGAGHKWGLFPSGSVAWRLSRESFFKSNTISDLKIRASYGVTGNQEIGNLNSMSTLGATTNGYIIGGQRVTIVLPQRYANPDLKWEQTAQFNAGVDFGILDGRIHGSVDYYIKKTTDLLLSIPVPSPTAVSTQLANVGSVQNKGVELELGADIARKSAFTWTANVVFSLNRNKVLSLSNDKYQGTNILTAPIQGTVTGLFAQQIRSGLPIGSFWGKKFIGIKSGMEQYLPKDTLIGCAQPKFTYGISNTFGYKDWSLVINLRGVQGNDVYNLTGNNLGYLSNLPGKNVLKTAVTSGVSRTQSKVYSTRWIEKGSFLRLDNLTLAYTLRSKQPVLSGMRIFVSGQNLFVITNYTGLDPEVNAEVSRVGVAPLGIDYLGYPKARTVSVGVNCNF